MQLATINSDYRSLAQTLLGGLFLLLPLTLLAQAQPGAGDLLRELEREQPAAVPDRPRSTDADAAPSDTGDGPRVLVQRFSFQGNTLLTDAQLDAVVLPWIDSKLTLGALQHVADTVARRYRDAGYLVRAYLPQQDIEDGVITIAIIEAVLGKVTIDAGGESRLRMDRRVAEDVVGARQRPGQPLQISGVERGSRLLADMPGVTATTMLTAGEEPGHTDVVVSVADEPLLRASVSPDSYGARSTGAERLRASLSLDNPRGVGDQASLDAQFSARSQYARLRYAMPIRYDGLRVGVSSSHYRYELGREFRSLDSEGSATTYGVDARYPLLRSGVQNINLTGRLEHRQYRNRQLNQTTSNKRVNALVAGVSGDVVDDFFGGGFNLYSLTATAGKLDLSGNDFDRFADRLTAGRHGSYQKLSWSLGRLQHLADRTTLWLSARGQYAFNNLDSSEGISLGGPSGVRAYPVLEGGGDQGWLATIEVRQRVHPEVSISGFYDHGRVQLHQDPWDGWRAGGDQPSAFALKGVGAGVIWSRPGNFSVQGSIAQPLGSSPLADSGKNTDGSNHGVRFWLSASKYF